MHEHWLLLPSFGVFLVLVAVLQEAAGAARLRALPRPLPWLLAAAFLSLCLVLARASHQRNEVWQDSVSFWRDATVHSPATGWVWNNLGTALLEKKDYAEALLALEKAEKEGGPNAASSHNIGLCLLALGRFDAAQRFFEAALRQSPGQPEILLALGQLHRRMGHPALAVDYLQSASRRGFTTYELYLALAEVLLQQHDKIKAEACLEEGLRRFPQNRELRDMLQGIPGERP
jgi:Tfp pilus assembly protein PilF